MASAHYFGARVRALAATFAALACLGLSPAVHGEDGVVDVVEYYNSWLDHYFVTAEAAEVAALDAGAFGGAWKRTGNSFAAWAVSGSPAGAVTVCRFFGTDRYRQDGTRIGSDSHFYTADPAECEFVRTAWPSLASDGRFYPAWTFESQAFAVRPPLAGECPSGTQSLFRAYNDGARGNPNHRYSTDPQALRAMQGWTFEGQVMCVRAPSSAPFEPVGDIRGCNVPDCRPAAAAGAAVDLVDVVVELGNSGSQPVAVTIPAGFVFVSESGAFQDGLLLDAVTVSIPASGSVRVLLNLYCLQQDRAAATTSALYRAGAVTTSPGLLAILNLPRPRTFEDGGLTATATQFALWEVTNGRGFLSAGQLDALGRIYALPETDPSFPKVLADFLDSLTVTRP